MFKWLRRRRSAVWVMQALDRSTAVVHLRLDGKVIKTNALFANIFGYTPEELTDGDLRAEGDLLVDGRDDIEGDAPPTNTRKAGRAVTAKNEITKESNFIKNLEKLSDVCFI